MPTGSREHLLSPWIGGIPAQPQVARFLFRTRACAIERSGREPGVTPSR